MNKYHHILIFLGFIVARAAYIVISGYDSCELCADSFFINELSERALRGNFDFDIGRFIAAPFYPLFIALHKWLLGNWWGGGLIVSQLILSGISGVYLFKLARLLFPADQRIAALATAVFCFFPMTLWWVHTFCTEVFFQSLFVIAMYYFMASIQRNDGKLVAVSAAIFSLVFLTKSHILLFSPFIAGAYLLSVKPFGRGLLFAGCYALISLAATIPFGVYNLHKHDEYVLSSNGLKFHFYTGNSEFGYASIVEVPPRGSPAFIHLKDMDMPYFNGAVHDSLLALPQKTKQQKYFELSLQWIKENPGRFAEMKAHNLLRFLTPGVSHKQYPLDKWLLSLLISLPVYLLGYAGILLALRKDFKTHFFMLGLFTVMLAFSVVFYAQNRFRTITLEPFYILYASYGFFLAAEFFSSRKQPPAD